MCNIVVDLLVEEDAGDGDAQLSLARERTGEVAIC